MRSMLIGVLVVLVCVSSVRASSVLEQKQSGSKSDVIGASSLASKFSLLDLSRLQIRNSYSLTYFSGHGGSTIGLFVNSLRYQISRPLAVQLDLAWLHQPGQLFSRDRGQPTDYGRLLPGFMLDYHPSKAFQLTIEYRSMPAYYYWNTGDSWRPSWLGY